MQLRKDDEYGLFQAQSPNCGRIQIEFKKHIKDDYQWEEVTTYLNGRIIDNTQFYEEEDYDYYEETDDKIMIHVCGDIIYIDKSSMVKIDKITDRNEFIINQLKDICGEVSCYKYKTKTGHCHQYYFGNKQFIKLLEYIGDCPVESYKYKWIVRRSTTIIEPS